MRTCWFSCTLQLPPKTPVLNKTASWWSRQGTPSLVDQATNCNILIVKEKRNKNHFINCRLYRLHRNKCKTSFFGISSVEWINYYKKYDLLRWRPLVKSVVYCQVFNSTKIKLFSQVTQLWVRRRIQRKLKCNSFPRQRSASGQWGNCSLWVDYFLAGLDYSLDLKVC